MKTPIRYAGGKSKAYSVITEQLLKFSRPKRIISPFMGGGSLESRWSSELRVKVIGYDIFDALVNFWQVLLTNPRELSDELHTLSPTKEKYTEVKEWLLEWDYTQTMLKDWHTDYYKREAKSLSPLKAAAYYYFNHNLSYGPMYLGWISKIYEDPAKWSKMVCQVKNYRNPNLSVEKGDFQEVIAQHKNDFLYLDPPYLLGAGGNNKMFKGVYPNANIDVHHSGFDHEALKRLLHNHEGGFILSYNDCDHIREAYSEFEQIFPKWHYSYALGETRIGKNKKNNDPKKSHEILIVKRK